MELQELEIKTYQEVITEQDLNGLKRKLEEEDDSFDINAPNEEVKNKTLLYEAVLKGATPLVSYLLERDARPDVNVERLGKSPLHVAAQKANKETFEHLLKWAINNGIDINLPETKRGKPPLILLVEKLCQDQANEEALQCLDMFIKEGEGILQLDKTDENGDSALVIAIGNENECVAKKLLQAGANVNQVTIYEGKTVLGLLEERLPQLLELAAGNDATDGSGDLVGNVWSLIEQKDEEAFNETVFKSSWPEGDFWNSGNGKKTFLQFACQERQVKVVQDLLALGADPNQVTDGDKCPPICIAGRLKSLDLLQILMDTDGCDFACTVEKDASKFNVLHCILDPDMMPWSKRGVVDWKNVNTTLDCLKLVLDHEKCSEDIKSKLLNESELPRGNTPLHHATRYPSQRLIKYLLENGADKSLLTMNIDGWEPIKRIDIDVVRDYFDGCVEFYNSPMEDSFRIVLAHDILLPERRYDSFDGNDEYIKQTEAESFLEEVQDPSSNEFCYVTPYRKKDVPELENLLKLGKSHMDLYDHPLVAGMIWLKWNHFKSANYLLRLFLWIQIAMHLLIWSFVLLTFGGKSLPFANDDCKNDNYMDFNCYPQSLSDTCRGLLIFVWAIKLCQTLARMAFQFHKKEGFACNCANKCKCKDTRSTCEKLITGWDVTKSNLAFLMSPIDFKVLVLMLVIIPILTFSSPSSRGPDSLFSFGFCRDLSGLLIVLSCIDICFLIRDHLDNRELAAMINWTEVVSGNILCFILIHIFLLVGFALSFYIQLHKDCNPGDGLYCKAEGVFNASAANSTEEDGDEGASEPGTFSSLTIIPMKVMAMFVGELEYGDHPFSSFPFNYIVFGLFVFLIVVVMMNLLTGMALMDVQDIRNASTDKTWHSLARTMNHWDDALITLSSWRAVGHWFKTYKRSLYVFRSDTKLVCRPNTDKRKLKKTGQLLSGEELITENSVKENAIAIVKERLKAEEEEFEEEKRPDSYESIIVSLNKRLSKIESRVLGRNRETDL